MASSQVLGLQALGKGRLMASSQSLGLQALGKGRLMASSQALALQALGKGRLMASGHEGRYELWICKVWGRDWAGLI